MKSKRDALIRDIAVLFTKYSISDWQEVVSLLQSGGPDLSAIASNLASITDAQHQASLSRQRSSKPKKKIVRATTSTSAKTGLSADKSIGYIQKSLSSKNMSALRNIYALSGGKDELPPNREALLIVLSEHLSGLPTQQFKKAVKLLEDKDNNHGSDYDKWVKMISGDNKS